MAVSTLAALTQRGRIAGLRLAERWYIDKRLAGLTRFAIAITVLNIIGHLWLGFEQSWLTPFVALAAAYGTELGAETAQAFAERRRARYLGSVRSLVVFLLSAHITGLAVAMLLYAAEQLWIVAFAAAVAIASKWLVRVRISAHPGRTLHVFNPSNLGITATLILFPSVGIAPPYQFTENVAGLLDWLLPLIVIITGSLLNLRLTGRMPLILTWFAAFAAQALIRALVNGTPMTAGLLPMTGFAFILFSFYMITDPATSPSGTRGQVMFGISVAALYGLLMQFHIVFGLFYALTVASGGRGLWMAWQARTAHVPASVGARL